MHRAAQPQMTRTWIGGRWAEKERTSAAHVNEACADRPPRSGPGPPETRTKPLASARRVTQRLSSAGDHCFYFSRARPLQGVLTRVALGAYAPRPPLSHHTKPTGRARPPTPTHVQATRKLYAFSTCLFLAYALPCLPNPRSRRLLLVTSASEPIRSHCLFTLTALRFHLHHPTAHDSAQQGSSGPCAVEAYLALQWLFVF